MIKKKYSLEHVLASRQNTREKEYWSKIFSGDLVKTGFPCDENIEEVLTENNMKREKFELPKTLFEKLFHLIDTTQIDSFGKVHNMGPALISFVDIIDSQLFQFLR